MPHLFVYGTLRRPVGGPPGDTHYHHRIVHDIISAEMATLPNAQLYDFGPYPGIGRDGTSTGSVRGEVFEISDDALAAADLVEGHPDFYERRLETVTLDDGTTDEAWAYWAPVALLSEAVLIDSGDWFDRVHSHDGSSIDEHLETAKSTLIDGAES